MRLWLQGQRHPSDVEQPKALLSHSVPGSASVTSVLLLNGTNGLEWNAKLHQCLDTAFAYLLGSIPVANSAAMPMQVSGAPDCCACVLHAGFVDSSFHQRTEI